MKSRTTIGVIGAGGFVGSRFMEMSRCAPEINAIPIIRSHKALARVKRLPQECRFADTADPLALAEDLAACDVIVNLTSGDSGKIVRDAQTIYQACCVAGVGTLVHMSSAIVLGRITGPEARDDGPLAVPGWSFYAREKARAEKLLKSCMTGGLPSLVVLRPGLIWGPGSVYSCMPAQELWSGRAGLLNSGKGICNLIHVDNLVRSIFAVARSTDSAPGFYNVADPETTTWLQFYAATAEGLGYPLDRIVQIPNARLPASFKLVSEWVVNNSQLCRFQKWTLRRLSSRLKTVIKRYAKGREMPPWRNGVTAERPVFSFTREMKLMQTMSCPVNCDKFRRHFGMVQTPAFEENMAENLRWLRFAGFAADQSVAN